MKYTVVITLICLLLLSICLFAQQANKSQVPNDKRIAKGNGAKQGSETGQPQQGQEAAAKVASATPDQAAAQDKAANAEELKENIEIQRKLVTATIGLVIVGILQAGILCWQAISLNHTIKAINAQAGIMERQTKATEKAAEAAKTSAEAAQANINIVISKERARIMVVAWHLDLTPAANDLCAVRYDVIYSGQSPAFIIDSGVWADAVESEDAETFRLWMAITELRPILPVNRDIIHCETCIPLKPDAIKEVNEGKKLVRVYGFIRYRDVFDIVRTTTFRYLWRPPSLYAIPGITEGGWIKGGAQGDNAEI